MDRPAPSPPEGGSVFRLVGDTRTVSFAGRTVLLHDLKGMRYLARLLAVPDREFHVLDLLAGGHGVARLDLGGDAGPALDEQARAAYRRRLAEIDEDLDEAGEAGDGERVARAQADREYLVRELAGAFGLGGRLRAVQSPSERARASVCRALRCGLARDRRPPPGAGRPPAPDGPHGHLLQLHARPAARGALGAVRPPEGGTVPPRDRRHGSTG